MTCYILDSAGAAQEVNNTVLDSAAATHEINGYALDSAATPWLVCVVITDVPTGGGEDPDAKRRRYQLIAAQKEEDFIFMVVKAYMKNTY